LSITRELLHARPWDLAQAQRPLHTPRGARNRNRGLPDLLPPDSGEYLLYRVNRQCQHGSFVRSSPAL